MPVTCALASERAPGPLVARRASLIASWRTPGGTPVDGQRIMLRRWRATAGVRAKLRSLAGPLLEFSPHRGYEILSPDAGPRLAGSTPAPGPFTLCGGELGQADKCQAD